MGSMEEFKTINIAYNFDFRTKILFIALFTSKLFFPLRKQWKNPKTSESISLSNSEVARSRKDVRAWTWQNQSLVEFFNAEKCCKRPESFKTELVSSRYVYLVWKMSKIKLVRNYRTWKTSEAENVRILQNKKTLRIWNVFLSYMGIVAHCKVLHLQLRWSPWTPRHWGRTRFLAQALDHCSGEFFSERHPHMFLYSSRLTSCPNCQWLKETCWERYF